ncbi:uncharacterized protein C19orf81 homolog [Pelodytes ibericus]
MLYALPRKQHLQSIIMEYEALDHEMPSIRKFPNSPPAQPLTLCMQCSPEKDFRHLDILKSIEDIVPKAFEMGRVSKIQFENMNVTCGTAGGENRWLITESDFQLRNVLLRSGLVIGAEYFPLRQQDDVMVEDYRMHLRRAMAKKKLLEMLTDSNNTSRVDNIV